MKFILVLVFLIKLQVDGAKNVENDGKWVWEKSNKPFPPEASIQKNSYISPVSDKTDECAYGYKVPLPNFRAYSTKISEIKCYEYIWQYKNRIDEMFREVRCYKKKYPDQRFIIGGSNSKLGEYPHMAAIGWRGTEEPLVFLCGGSIISPNFILTAAHCSKAAPSPSLSDTVPRIVRVGYTNIARLNMSSFGRGDYNIKRILNHPNYKSPSRYYDVALIELQTNIIFDHNIQPACLWTKPNLSDVKNAVTVTGWGATEEKATSGVKDLMVATLNLINSKVCNRTLKSFCNRRWCGIRDNQMCAGKLEGGVDVCQGDSGGPIQTRLALPNNYDSYTWMHQVIGVTSFGIGCARPDLPGVYSRVSSYLNWLEPIVWPQ